MGLDGIDRTTTLTHADSTAGHTYFGGNVSTGGGISSQLCSSSTYGLGYPILSVDEAGMKLQKWNNGFGRLIEVDEPDSSGSLTVGTCYSYSPLNKVTQVVQGAETRSYTYDWLGRVTAASDPESGTTNLYYLTSSGIPCSGDPAAVCRRTDARNITITYGYDAGNRLVSKTYSDTTPAVQYAYDGNSLTGCATAPPTLTITNPNGHRTAMCDGSGATAWGYDAAGHITTEKRIIQGVTQAISISYAYNPDGSLASVTYPSNHVVSYSYSNAQRAISAIDTASGINYVQNVTYAPQGAIASALHGKVTGGFSGITESYAFNSRLEPTSIRALNQTTAIMSLVPGFSLPSGNNGTVASVGNADGRNTGRNQTYTYDPLNRISTAQSQATSSPDCWGQSYGYDRWANLLAMNITQCSGYPLSVSVDSHNHITNTGFSYDLSGNMTADGLNSYSWDAENGLNSAAGVNYTYDGDRLRVAKSSGTLYWRSLPGQTLAETDLTGSTTNAQYHEYIFFAGRRIARRETSGNILYYFSDQVDSTRVIFRSDNQTVCFDSDYTPFGTELPASGVSVTCAQNYKFTGYERDTESGLDYAIYRYYNPSLSRFMSNDPLAANIWNPQSLNGYSYVLNNPCSLVDPFGLTTCTFNVNINNEAGLTPEQIRQIETQIENIFGQTDDGHNDWVNIQFVSDAKTADTTLNLGNYPFAGITLCVFACTNPRVGVNQVANVPGTGFNRNLAIGSAGAHELGHWFGLSRLGGDQFSHQKQGSGNLMMSDLGLGGGYSPFDNHATVSLTQAQIAEIFKKCLKLHPQKCGNAGGCS